MDRLRAGNIIDILAVSSAPVAAWVALGQAVHKQWAHSGFIILWGMSAGAWVIKILLQAKKKRTLRCARPKRSKSNKKLINIITRNRRKNNSMLKKYFH